MPRIGNFPGAEHEQTIYIHRRAAVCTSGLAAIECCCGAGTGIRHGARGGVYDSEDKWLGDEVLLTQKVAIAEALEGDLVLSELSLPAGNYAFSVFYDVNNNDKLDTNFIGIPKEPVAISNNARPSMGPPKYKDAVFAVGSEPVIQRIEIEAI